MGRHAKHINEFVLTRWCIAQILEHADDTDRLWLKTQISGFRGNLWRYQRGFRALNWQDPRGLVATLDTRFPGCVEIFKGTTGQLLMAKPVSHDQLIRAIRVLGDPQRTILLGGGYGTEPSGSIGPRTIDDVFGELEQFPEYRTLQAIVYMLAWANRIQNHDTWNSTCLFYHHMIPRIMYFQQVPHFEHIFEAIDAIAPFREIKANVRRDRHRSWRREIPEFKKLRKKAAIEVMNSWNETPRLFIGKGIEINILNFDDEPPKDSV